MEGIFANSYSYINATLNGVPIEIKPAPGSCTFIHNYAKFTLHKYVTVVGVDNDDTFYNVHCLQHLFPTTQPIFVRTDINQPCLLNWLHKIDNPYLHCSNIDLETITNYTQQFKLALKERASFYTPPALEKYLMKFGDAELYKIQKSKMSNRFTSTYAEDESVLKLLHKHERTLNQNHFLKPL